MHSLKSVLLTAALLLLPGLVCAKTREACIQYFSGAKPGFELDEVAGALESRGWRVTKWDMADFSASCVERAALFVSFESSEFMDMRVQGILADVRSLRPEGFWLKRSAQRGKPIFAILSNDHAGHAQLVRVRRMSLHPAVCAGGNTILCNAPGRRNTQPAPVVSTSSLRRQI